VEGYDEEHCANSSHWDSVVSAWRLVKVLRGSDSTVGLIETVGERRAQSGIRLFEEI